MPHAFRSAFRASIGLMIACGFATMTVQAEPAAPFNGAFAAKFANWLGGPASIRLRIITPGHAVHLLNRGVVYGSGYFSIALPRSAAVAPFSTSVKGQYDVICPGTVVVTKDSKMSWSADFVVYRNGVDIGTIELPPALDTSWTVLLHTDGSYSSHGYCSDPPGTTAGILDHPHTDLRNAGWFYDVNEVYAQGLGTDFSAMIHEYSDDKLTTAQWTFIPKSPQVGGVKAVCDKARFNPCHAGALRQTALRA